MVTPTKGARLGSSPAHERLILANLASSLFEHGQIKTTQVKAKRVQPLAEKLITIAKKQTLASHRQLVATLKNKSIVHLLVTDLAEQFKDREGGYTRVIKIERRKGDQAEMAIIELVQEPVVKKPSTKNAKKLDETPATPKKEEKKDVETNEADEKAPVEKAEANEVKETK
ncbi:MAG: 50S ribosomal protein L17 [Candidatus Ancillula sp.]|jgi:large subunit ribosomal protein L17|nr:50S ribosomal protein L17 [Candidatus Ancillula sp.]